MGLSRVAGEAPNCSGQTFEDERTSAPSRQPKPQGIRETICKRIHFFILMLYIVLKC